MRLHAGASVTKYRRLCIPGRTCHSSSPSQLSIWITNATRHGLLPDRPRRTAGAFWREGSKSCRTYKHVLLEMSQGDGLRPPPAAGSSVRYQRACL